jgi:hypothetical protein
MNLRTITTGDYEGDRHSHTVRVLACGVMTGLSVGLLFAPTRGAVMRARLSSASRTGYRRTTRFVRRRRRDAQRTQARVMAFADQARAHLDTGRRKITAAACGIGHSIEHARSHWLAR